MSPLLENTVEENQSHLGPPPAPTGLHPLTCSRPSPQLSVPPHLPRPLTSLHIFCSPPRALCPRLTSSRSDRHSSWAGTA